MNCGVVAVRKNWSTKRVYRYTDASFPCSKWGAKYRPILDNHGHHLREEQATEGMKSRIRGGQAIQFRPS